MINILTVHWKTNFFKRIQYNFIKKNISNFRIWTFADKIPDEEKDLEIDRKYYFCQESKIIDHRTKLDKLAEIASKQSSEDDVFLFLDGDSWPIAPLDDLISETLFNFPLAAVIRLENNERHTHPCFTFTKVNFWNEKKLSWKEGYIDGKKYNVNYIKHVLERDGLEWRKFFRTKGLTDHKVFFSIYGDTVYHHGAGFRPPVSGYCVKNKLNITREENLSMIEKFIDKYGE